MCQFHKKRVMFQWSLARNLTRSRICAWWPIIKGDPIEMEEAALAKDRALLGQLLETFVFQELRRQASWHEDAISFYHFRDKDSYEVDIVLEIAGRDISGVEVKASATVTDSDFRGLRKLKDASGARFTAGVVLYDGENLVCFGENLFAVPIKALWSLK